MCYLERDGVERDGSSGRLFSTFTDEASRSEFVARTREDPHQFRVVLSLEGGAAYEDLTPFTRDVMARVEADLDTILDWVAAAHYDTGRPHVHVIIRGVTEQGRALNIAGDYLRFGIAQRASEVLTRDLGLETALESGRRFEREVDAERLTQLDRVIIDRAENGLIDLTAARLDNDQDRVLQQQLIRRLRRLERMRLAVEEKPLRWQLSPSIGDVLQTMSERATRMNVVHRAVVEANLSRRPELYTFDPPTASVTGSIIACGRAAGERSRNYIVLDGIDGRTHYIDIGEQAAEFPIGSIVGVSAHRTGPRRADKTIAAIAQANDGRYDSELHLRTDRTATMEVAAAHVRRLEAIDRATGLCDRNVDGSWKIGPDYLDRVREYERLLADAKPVLIKTHSTVSLSQQIGARGATWLDRQLVGETSQDHAAYGFGREVQDALLRRQAWLVEHGLARREGDRVIYRTDLIDSLIAQEVRLKGRQLEGQLHKPFMQTIVNERVEGTFRRTLDLASGRFALIEKSHEFTLVPWQPDIEPYLGRAISGIPFGATYDWSLGRSRGLSR